MSATTEAKGVARWRFERLLAKAEKLDAKAGLLRAKMRAAYAAQGLEPCAIPMLKEAIEQEVRNAHGFPSV